jgi:hypothetical protein
VTGEDTHHYTTEDLMWYGRGFTSYPKDIIAKRKILFPCGESNPGRGGESAES